MNSYRLSQVGDIVTGTTPSTKDKKYWDGNIPFYSPADFHGDVYCCNTERTITEKGLGFGRFIPENSIMVTCIGSIGKIGVNGTAGLTNQQINTLIPFHNFDHEYVYYLILNNIEKLINSAPQTTIPILNKKEFGKFSFNFHKFPEQQKIAYILQTIDQTIEKTEALIKKYQQIKAGLMHDLFTRGITADGKLRPPREQAPELYQETPIGWVPKAWGFTTCSDVCEKIIDCKNRTPPITPDGYPVIRTPNVRHGIFIDKELVYTDHNSYLIWTARGKPRVGDILITREAPVGEVCKIPIRHHDACLGQRMMLYRTDLEKIDNDYFLYALQSLAVQSRLDLISGGSTVGHVRVGDIRDLWMYLPSSRKEQENIAHSLNAASINIEKEFSMLNKLIMCKSGLMHDLLTGKVPVTIDSPDTSHVG